MMIKIQWGEKLWNGMLAGCLVKIARTGKAYAAVAGSGKGFPFGGKTVESVPSIPAQRIRECATVAIAPRCRAESGKG